MVTSGPTLQVNQVTTGVPSSGKSMAVDEDGNVFLMHDAGVATIGGPSVSSIQPSGAIDQFHVTGLADPGQLQYNPADGNVCFPDMIAGQMELRLIVPSGGTALVLSASITAKGLAIDNSGSFYLGAKSGPSGAWIYFHDFPATTPSFLGTGCFNNGHLLALHTGDILIADGPDIARFAGGATPPILVHSIATTNLGFVTSMTGNALNEFGGGILFMEWEFDVAALGGTGTGAFLDAQGLNRPSFAAETWNLPSNGVQAIASGLDRDVFWRTTRNNAIAATGTLTRITQVPTPHVQGTCLASKTARVVALSWFGPPAGGDPVLHGLIPAAGPGSPVFMGPFGLLDLDPSGPAYVRLLDGIGVFGPPDPCAATQPGGALQLSAFIPALAVPVTLAGQGVVLSPDAPNGLFFITNVETITLP